MQNPRCNDKMVRYTIRNGTTQFKNVHRHTPYGTRRKQTRIGLKRGPEILQEPKRILREVLASRHCFSECTLQNPRPSSRALLAFRTSFRSDKSLVSFMRRASASGASAIAFALRVRTGTMYTDGPASHLCSASRNANPSFVRVRERDVVDRVWHAPRELVESRGLR